jgi:serine/threonine protein phosphatase PrpC
MLTNDEIYAVLKTAPTLDVAAQELVNAANASGGGDNVTVVLVSVRAPARGLGDREPFSGEAKKAGTLKRDPMSRPGQARAVPATDH